MAQDKVQNWKILIVDDDPEVHIVTKMVMDVFEFKGRGIDFLSAYSKSDGQEILNEHPDIALALIDVVMEEQYSGLELIRYIRETVQNSCIRIILRTGQPGTAPEEEVLKDYDINDYKEKTDLSAKKLITSVITALRSYDDLVTIQTLNQELEDKVRQRTIELEVANKDLRKYIKTLESDREAGARIQYKLLPMRERQYGEYSFSRFLMASTYLSGDFLDYFEINDSTLGFYMADVSGHGISSAFITVLIKNFFYKYLEKLRFENNLLLLKPSLLLDRLNKEMIRDDLGKYFTLFYGIIKKDEGVMVYSNCGQFPTPVICYQGEQIFLESRGKPIGLFKFAQFKEERIVLPKQFSMLFISDGILEILEQESLEEKKEYLLSLLKNDDFTIQDLMKSTGVEDYGSLPDDVTFLLIKRGGTK